MEIVLEIATALGLALLIAGLRGRRIDEHPLCRACGIDLFGRAPDSARCAECGADLGHRRAIRIGHRQRFVGVFTVGCLLAVPSLLVLSVFAYVSVRGIDLTPYKTDWYLAHDVTTPNTVTARKSMAELRRRLQAGSLSDGRVASVTATCLAYQGQPALPWDPRWGLFIEQARATGKVSDDQWALYARQSFVVDAEASIPDAGLSMPNAVRVRDIPSTKAALTVAPRTGGGSFVAVYTWTYLRIDDQLPEPLTQFHISPVLPVHGQVEIAPGTVKTIPHATPVLPTFATQRLAAGDTHFTGHCTCGSARRLSRLTRREPHGAPPCFRRSC